MTLSSLLVWGDIGFDLYPDGEARPGGCALNVALSAAGERPPFPVGVAGALGEDGAPLRARLAAAGVETVALRTLAGASSRQPIRLGPGGERELYGYQTNVLADLPLDAELAATLGAAGLVYVPTFAQTARWASFALDHGRAALDLMDLNEDLSAEGDVLGRALAAAALVFCGLHLGHPRLDELRARGREGGATLVVTLGADGALAVAGGEEVRVPAAPARVVDTTGCGDAFAGAFLAAWGAGQPLRACLERGAARAARAAEHLGAAPPP
ncbi:MAG: carbohydrate kinase family protein [Planctomycetota bacterium]